MAEQKRLVWCDWSAIEARVAPFLSMGSSPEGDASAWKLLNMFSDGICVYLACASDITGEKITDKEDPRRQSLGKVPVLSLGFLGGLGALNAMARNYGVPLFKESEGQDIVHRWRAANPWATDFGAELERQAKRAIRRPGELFQAGRITILYHDMLGGTLMLYLPCGRPLCYPQCKIRMVERFEGQEEPTIVYQHATYGPTALWKGAMIENVTQGYAASLLRACIVRLDRDTTLGWTVAHTHDEIVQETLDSLVPACQERLVREMEYIPDHAEGLPLAAEAGSGYRYYHDGSIPE